MKKSCYMLFLLITTIKRMKACENGIQMSKEQDGMFSSHTISPFPSPVPGKGGKSVPWHVDKWIFVSGRMF